MPGLKLETGQVLGERFLILEELGRGGMATIFKASDLCNAGQIVVVKVPLPMFSSGVTGSSGYIAPEQIRRKRGRRSVDIYGVGSVLYEMLTGLTPFPDDDPFAVASARLIGDPPAPRALNPRISRQAEEIVLRAIRRDPAERYASVVEMKADLDGPDRVVVSGLSERLRPPARWRRSLAVVRYAALVGIVPVVAQVVLFGLLWHHFAHRR